MGLLENFYQCNQVLLIDVITQKKKYHGGIFMEIPAVANVSVNQTYYYLYDGLGDVVNLVDGYGNLVQTYYYDAFGKSTNVKHDVVNKKQFTGKEIDEDSGLYYFFARYYDPETGRFLSEDSEPYLNLYIYCHDDPINKIDPDGRSDMPNDPIVEVNGCPMRLSEAMTLMTGAMSSAGYPNPSGRVETCGASESIAEPNGRGRAEEVGKEANSAKAGEVTMRDSGKINYTQDNMSSGFSDGRKVSDLTNALKSGQTKPENVKPIRVFQQDGQLNSLDNRRLKAHQDAGKPIATVPASNGEVAREKSKGKNVSSPTIKVRGQDEKTIP